MIELYSLRFVLIFKISEYTYKRSDDTSHFLPQFLLQINLIVKNILVKKYSLKSEGVKDASLKINCFIEGHIKADVFHTIVIKVINYKNQLVSRFD